MNVTSYEKKEKNIGELTVEVTAAEFDEAVNSAYKKNKGKISVPGFRKGKAPRKIIENMYGASIFYEDAIDILFPTAFAFGVEQEKLKTVGRPSVLDVNIGDDKSATIKYSIALYPEVTIGEYKGIAANRADDTVTDEEIDGEINTVRQRNARIQTVDRSSIDGDTVVIDYEGFIEGAPFEGGKSEGYSLVLGSQKFIPGFEEQIVGMSAGDDREINLVFPDEYTEEFAGKPVTFKIKAHEVKENILPEADDEFAKDVSEFDTLADYRADVKAKLEEKKKKDNDRAFEDDVMTKVVDTLVCDIPEVMVQEQIDTALQNFNYNLSKNGLDIDMYLEMMHITLDMFKQSMRPSAEKQLKIGLALEKIAELENITPTEEEMDEGYKMMATRYGVDEKTAKEALAVDVIEREMKLKKAADLVLDSVTADTSEAQPEEKTAKKAAKKSSKKSAEGAEETDKAE